MKRLARHRRVVLALLSLFLLGALAGSLTFVFTRGEDGAAAEPAAAASTAESTVSQGSGLPDPQGAENPCAEIQPQIDPRYIPAGFVRQDRVQPKAAPTDHTIWVCNPEPGLYVKVDVDTGQIIAVDYVLEERTAIGDAIRAEAEAAIQSQFRPVDLPARVEATCDPSWQRLTFDGATVCVPTGWKQTDRAGPDYLVIESPDGFMSVLLSPLSLPTPDLRGCNNALQVTGPSGYASVCSIRVAEEGPPSILYGFVFTSGRYAQITMQEGQGEPYLPEALTVVMNILEGTTP